MEQWLEPKIIITLLSTLIASVIIPVLLHHFKYKRERAEKLFETKKEAYLKYFQKFEKSAEIAGQDYEKYTNETLPSEFLKLLESGSSNEAILAFQKAVGEFPNKLQEGHRKAIAEMTSLRIVCSKKLFEMIIHFEKLQQEMLEQAAPWLEEANRKSTQPDLSSPIAIQMRQRGEQIKILSEAIIGQMREELGTNKG